MIFKLLLPLLFGLLALLIIAPILALMQLRSRLTAGRPQGPARATDRAGQAVIDTEGRVVEGAAKQD